MIKWGVSGKTWAQVYLQEPRLEVGVDQDIETKNFKTICAVHSIFLQSSHYMMFTSKQSLQYHIIDPRPEQVHIDANLFQMFAERTQTPLKPEIILLSILILHEVLILLINGVVRQVHVLVIFVDL